MRYLIGLFATLGLIILILVLLLRGGGSSPTEAKALKLADYATSGSAAHYIIDGPIVADQKHQEVKIDVDAEQVTFTLYAGYDGEVTKQQTYLNSDKAYAVFLRALQNEGFTKGNADPKLQDERGVCPLGQRRIYAFTDGSKQLMRFWSTGCDIKTFGGKINNVATLFRNQVPDYNEQVSGTSFDTL